MLVYQRVMYNPMLLIFRISQMCEIVFFFVSGSQEVGNSDVTGSLGYSSSPCFFHIRYTQMKFPWKNPQHFWDVPCRESRRSSDLQLLHLCSCQSWNLTRPHGTSAASVKVGENVGIVGPWIFRKAATNETSWNHKHGLEDDFRLSFQGSQILSSMTVKKHDVTSFQGSINSFNIPPAASR